MQFCYGKHGSLQGMSWAFAPPLEEEVWLVSGLGHLRQSALVHDQVSQGRTALSTLSAVGGFLWCP